MGTAAAIGSAISGIASAAKTIAGAAKQSKEHKQNKAESAIQKSGEFLQSGSSITSQLINQAMSRNNNQVIQPSGSQMSPAIDTSAMEADKARKQRIANNAMTGVNTAGQIASLIGSLME